MIRFILADLRRQWPGVAVIALIIALATALGVAVTLQERALRLGSARAAAAFDLVVGAPGSETQLVLSAVFLQTAPLPLMPGDVLGRLLTDPRVAWAAPVGFGDRVDDAPIVGTTEALLTAMGGIDEGRPFGRLGEAVAGARAPLKPGDVFYPTHAAVQGEGAVHSTVTYTVVGRLAATGTPWDRAMLVPIEAVWRIHGLGADEHHDHDQEAVFDFDTPVRPEALSAPDAPGLPAILVKPRGIADAYKLRQELRGERTLAVFPGEVLTRLYGTLGDARVILSVVALGAQGLVAAAILLVVVAHVLQRRRQIGALRAFGARRSAVFTIVWAETFLIVGGGLVAGFGLGYLAARLIADSVTAASGIPLPVGFAAADGAQLLLLLGLGAAAAAAPAVLAYRQSPAGALRA